jgi:ABC-type antimicrobial peptide transport system permease subunit
MRYASSLLTNWSRREWLSVAVVAVTAAFLVGSTVLLLSAGAYTATLDDDLDSAASVTYVDSYGRALERASSDDLVFAFGRLTVDGTSRRVVGVPRDAPGVLDGASVGWKEATLPRPPAEGLTAPVSRPRQRLVEGERVTVSPHLVGETIFPDDWYVGSASTVRSLGATGALVVDAGAGGERAAWRVDGVPLIAALPFLVEGIGQIVRTLSVAAFGGGLLVLVVVYNVTRMSIRDRRVTVRVARATGAPPHALFLVLVGRVLLLSVVGVSLGFAVGLIATNAVANAATYAGLPVSLRIALTPDVARAVAHLCAFLAFTGVAAGALAALPAVRGDPADPYGDASGGAGNGDGGRPSGLAPRIALFRPSLVDGRAVVPTAATLSVFVLVLLLTAAIGGAVAPLTTTSTGTVVEAGAPHPLNSRISEEYADVLRSQGITASPEVIYAQVRDGRPYLIRGANFSSFSAVTGATLVEGRAPAAGDEAVIGASLAETLDVRIGETLTIGGSVTPGVRRVTVVGRFEGTGVTDDQLVVPLDTVQPLATGREAVHLIRTGDAAAAFASLEDRSGGLVVTDLAGPRSVAVGEPYSLTVTVQNLGAETVTEDVDVSLGDRTVTRTLTVSGGEARRATVERSFDEAGSYTVAAGGLARSVEVFRPRSFVLPPEYPRRAPPGATLIVPATTPNESVVSGATVTLGDRTGETNERGVVLMRVPTEPGTYALTIEKPGYDPERHTLVVEAGAPKRLSARLSVSPSAGTRLTDPTVEIQVANPWGRFLVRNLTLVTPAGGETRTVEMTGGNITRIRLSAAEAGLADDPAPGRYDLRLVSDGAVLATATYRVVGDERIAATLATRGEYSGGTGIDRALRNVFGDVRLLFLVLMVLAGLSTVGGTTATFAHAVHANRRSIGVYRATGASRRRVLGILLADAIRLAIPAAAVAFGVSGALLWGLARADSLVVFGVRLSIPLSPSVLGATALGAVALAATSALTAGYAFLAVDPSELLRSER